jgi:hypothetical protein
MPLLVFELLTKTPSMKKHKKTITSLSLVLLGLGALQAQESPTASGGEATGSGGTSSYSIGQIITATDNSASGSVSTGVQQAYEIFLVTGIKETSINLKMSIYPNPTTDYLSLEVEKENLEKLTYQLFDLQGKLIARKNVTETKTTIRMEEFSKSTYLLQVIQNNQEVKSYRIIKL